MDNCISEAGVSPTRFTPGVWKMHLAIFLIGLFIICIVGYGFYAGDRINTVDASMVRAAMKIKLEASTTNLVIEGLLGDGFAADFEPIWEPLDAAFRSFRSIFDDSKHRITVLAFQAYALDSDDIENLSAKLAIFKDSLHVSISPKPRTSIKTYEILPKSLKIRRCRSPTPIPHPNPLQIHSKTKTTHKKTLKSYNTHLKIIFVLVEGP